MFLQKVAKKSAPTKVQKSRGCQKKSQNILDKKVSKKLPMLRQQVYFDGDEIALLINFREHFGVTPKQEWTQLDLWSLPIKYVKYTNKDCWCFPWSLIADNIAFSRERYPTSVINIIHIHHIVSLEMISCFLHLILRIWVKIRTRYVSIEWWILLLFSRYRLYCMVFPSSHPVCGIFFIFFDMVLF